MKKRLMTIGILMLTASLAVNAGPNHHRFQDTAKVIDVEPIYETIEINHPQRYCWDEDVSYYEPGQKTYTGTMLGGIIGGVMANQIHRGRGRGKDAATLAGVLLGGAIGHDLSQQGQHGHYTATTERRCEVENTTTYEEQLIGYRVRYRYKGHIFSTRTKHHPGKRIPVRVRVAPIDGI
jgi:uncharacterized protein YcfJ